VSRLVGLALSRRGWLGVDGKVGPVESGHVRAWQSGQVRVTHGALRRVQASQVIGRTILEPRYFGLTT
jgi:hypothetical protein